MSRAICVAALAMILPFMAAAQTAPTTPAPIAPAAQPDPTPRNTGELIAYCPTHSDVCSLVVQAVGIGGMVAHQSGSYCPVGERDPKIALQQVLGWLAQHPELSGAPVRDGVRQAIVGVWPC